MSWDLLIQDLPKVDSIEDIPDDFVPASLGKRQSVIDRIAAALPAADFADPAWGVIEGSDWSIEVNIGEEPECISAMLHVRGMGSGAIVAVSAIMDALGKRASDCQTSQFFDRDSALDSFLAWQDYRGHAIAATAPPPRSGRFARPLGK
jgi:hypothetical protein